MSKLFCAHAIASQGFPKAFFSEHARQTKVIMSIFKSKIRNLDCSHTTVTTKIWAQIFILLWKREQRKNC